MVGMPCCLGASMRVVLFIRLAGLWFALCTGVMLLVVLVVTLCVYATLVRDELLSFGVCVWTRV